MGFLYIEPSTGEELTPQEATPVQWTPSVTDTAEDALEPFDRTGANLCHSID